MIASVYIRRSGTKRPRKSSRPTPYRSPPAEGSTDGTNATDKKAHIFATFVSATDCRQELAVAEKGNPGRGTAWSTPGLVPSAHAVRFDSNNPVACS
jgi:hypothetical protein